MMKTKMIALFLGFALLPLFAADRAFDILVARVKFDDSKSLMIVTSYGEKGELAIGTDVIQAGLTFFEGRRIVVNTNPPSGDGNFVELVYELLGKPVRDAKTGVIEQPLVYKRFLIPVDGSEKKLTLGPNKTLSIQLTTTPSHGENKIKLDPKDALEVNQSE